MLPSSRRVRQKSFQEIFKNGRFFSGKNLSLTVLKNSKFPEKPSSFAFSVSKKVSNKAVLRNKLRRRGYSIVKGVINQIKPGFLAVFVLKKGAEKLIFQEYKEEIESLLAKSNLL